jgi:dienelactone hydrolase
MRLALRFVLAILLAGIGPFAVPALQAQSRGEPIPGTPLEKHELVDAASRRITYYISHPSRPAPLMLMIQGSGCEPVMHLAPTGNYSSLYNFLPYASEGRFTVMAVEKPFAGLTGDGRPGGARNCSPEFNRDFTAESWLAAIRAALADARRLPQVDRHRMLAFGTSEGAVMAALLAGAERDVTDVAFVSGSGTTQFFDFIAFAYQRCFDRSACIADAERQLRAIAAAPDSATDFAWGHPYRRWSSFFRADPGTALLGSHARVYVALGTADNNVPALSQEVLVARLLAAGRDVTVRRIPDAGHGLIPAGAEDWSGVDAEFRRILDWFQPR